MAEDVPENHVVSEDVGMLTGVTESPITTFFRNFEPRSAKLKLKQMSSNVAFTSQCDDNLTSYLSQPDYFFF